MLHRVLIVDDNEDAGDMLAAFVGQLGYEVFVARDGLQGFSIACKTLPQVAILDIGLPGMTGYELARALRQVLGHRAPQLIALTGYATSRDRQLAYDCGFIAHLAKPVDLDRLTGLVCGMFPAARTVATSTP